MHRILFYDEAFTAIFCAPFSIFPLFYTVVHVVPSQYEVCMFLCLQVLIQLLVH